MLQAFLLNTLILVHPFVKMFVQYLIIYFSISCLSIVFKLSPMSFFQFLCGRSTDRCVCIFISVFKTFLFSVWYRFLSQKYIGRAVVLGMGRFSQKGRCKEGCKKPRAVWSTV